MSLWHSTDIASTREIHDAQSANTSALAPSMSHLSTPTLVEVGVGEDVLHRDDGDLTASSASVIRKPHSPLVVASATRPGVHRRTAVDDRAVVDGAHIGAQDLEVARSGSTHTKRACG